MWSRGVTCAMSEQGWDQDAIASLETELLHTKASADASTFFPSHAFARGGIGVLVSTGSARGPLRRLPQATQASRNLHASSRPTTCPEGIGRGWLGSSLDATSLASAAAASAVVGSAAGIPDVARHEWERVVPHPANFVSTARQTRVHDVRPASKWASLSMYETDPQQIKRHLDVVAAVDQVNVETKKAERQDENVRHYTWAVQQRETFRRQRQETAERYMRSGLPARKSYSARPAGSAAYASSRLAESLGGDHISLDGSFSGRAAVSAPIVSLPKQTYVNVYQRMAVEARDALQHSAEAMRKRSQEAAKRKQEEELRGQMAEMDSFDHHVVTAFRHRGRQAGGNNSDDD